MITNSPSKISFNNSIYKEFSEELQTQVGDYFKLNKISRFANLEMKLKSLLMVLLLLVPYGILLFFHLPFFQMILLSILSGIGVVGVGFNISHDACHNAYSSSSKINKLLGFSFNLVGMNAYLWKIKHNLAHHTYTNIYGKDEDLFEGDDIRLSPDAPYKPIHRFQHIYYFLFYPLYLIIWIFIYDFQILFRFNGNGSPDPNKKHPSSELFLFILFKAIYITSALVLPFYLIEAKWWEILICYLTVQGVAGVIMAWVVKLGHSVENVIHVQPDENGVVQNSWMVHELQTTSNFSVNNPFVSYFTGGLNFQIEHHLFPRICSVHYSKISPIVAEVLKKYQLPYNLHKNMITGLVSHYKFMKRLSFPDSGEPTPS